MREFCEMVCRLLAMIFIALVALLVYQHHGRLGIEETALVALAAERLVSILMGMRR